MPQTPERPTVSQITEELDSGKLEQRLPSFPVNQEFPENFGCNPLVLALAWLQGYLQKK